MRARRTICLAAALAVAALAIAFRCWRLFTVPPGLYVDEVLTARNALSWRLDLHASLFGSRPLLTPGWVETWNLYLAFASALMWLGGDGLLGIRLVSVLPSLAAVPLLYWLGAQLAGRRTGLLAAFLLACSHWAARSGRTGWDAVLMVTLQLAALGCLVYARRRDRVAPALVAGTLVGLSLYTYVASRLVLVHAVLWLAWEAFAARHGDDSTSREPDRRAPWRFLACVAVALVIAMPSRRLLERATGSVRVMQLSVFAHDHPWSAIADNVVGHVLMFNLHGGTYARDALPGFPMLDPITGVLFLFGLFAVALPLIARWLRRLPRRRRQRGAPGGGLPPRAAKRARWDTDRQAGTTQAAPPSWQPPSRHTSANETPSYVATAQHVCAADGLRFRLLISWPAIMVLAGVLSTSGEGPPYPYRVLALAPWACLVAAIGGVKLWDATPSRFPVAARATFATLALLAVVAINAWIIFLAGPRDPGTRHIYGTAPTQLGLWLADHAQGRPVVILPGALTSPPLPRGYEHATANPTNFFRPLDDLAAVHLAAGLYSRNPERALDPLRPAGDIDLLPALPTHLARPTILILPSALIPAAARRFHIDRRTDLRDLSGARLATLIEARP
ncbi:MAG TPA: glycosyltransferase family 39 protein [Thermoanaerobaculia bacterium]|nr:glycosyltransferase family 39 protein [Thermoanaerobaculia bacterium]